MHAWEMEETLRKVAFEGGTYSDAARILKVSRSAIAGAASRLGISFPKKDHRRAWKNRSPRPATPKPPRTLPLSTRSVVVKRPQQPFVQRRGNKGEYRPPIPFKVRHAKVIPLNKRLEDLGNYDCKFPYGDAAPYLFCGHAFSPGSKLPYCDKHFELCAPGYFYDKR
jgi:hypothetical protein